MIQRRQPAANVNVERTALRRRIRDFYRRFNREDWSGCFARLDPRLRQAGKVEESQYRDSLATFRQAYGEVEIWHTRVNLYLDAKNNKHDARPFAYVYVFWQDAHQAFHVFRERWVLDDGKWYTRVIGLVVHQQAG
ncbi:MAG: hypothetical protein JNM56_12545 [Planctomycetia bacterium]|nr:hypothetical protein [Planctomycetia bacterium]